MFENNKTALKTVAIIEGYSFLILIFIAMPLKYMFGYPIATKIFGSIHGALFMWFLYQLYIFHKEYNFGFKFTIMAFISSLIPFGTFYLKNKLED